MNRTTLVIFAVVFILLGGGAFFLANMDLEPPSDPIRKVISDDRFPR